VLVKLWGRLELSGNSPISIGETKALRVSRAKECSQDDRKDITLAPSKVPARDVLYVGRRATFLAAFRWPACGGPSCTVTRLPLIQQQDRTL
jgi:hypothetical protein